MNPKLQSIYNRRSIRIFSQQKVSDDMVKDILEAAMAAPSAVGRDPWEFIVLRDLDSRVSISEALPSGQMLASSALGIVVCGDLNRAHDQQLSYMIQDCSAAIENMLLAISMLGLGGCWLGVHPRQQRIDQITKVCNLPSNIVPVACVAIGYAAEHKPGRSRYNESRIHKERFGVN